MKKPIQLDIYTVYEIEKKMISEKVPFYLRANYFATEIYPILYGHKCISYPNDINHQMLREFYNKEVNLRSYYPKPVVVGFVRSLDRVRTFKIQDIAGSPHISISNLLGFDNDKALMQFCFNQPLILDNLKKSILNCFIINDCIVEGSYSNDLEEGKLWKEVGNHFNIITHALENNFENNTIFQNIYLFLELTIKAISKNRMGEFKRIHDLSKLINNLDIEKEDREKLLYLVKDFPDYVATRYDGLEKSFSEVVTIAIQAQDFVATIMEYSKYQFDKPVYLQ